jgi:hypothetical protein
MKIKKMRVDYGDWRKNVNQSIKIDRFDAVITFNENNQGCHIYTDSPIVVKEFEKDLNFLCVSVIKDIKCFYTFFEPDFVLSWIGERFYLLMK